jgi:hypothetical protein
MADIERIEESLTKSLDRFAQGWNDAGSIKIKIMRRADNDGENYAIPLEAINAIIRVALARKRELLAEIDLRRAEEK